jgi:hypothetical protein
MRQANFLAHVLCNHVRARHAILGTVFRDPCKSNPQAGAQNTLSISKYHEHMSGNFGHHSFLAAQKAELFGRVHPQATMLWWHNQDTINHMSVGILDQCTVVEGNKHSRHRKANTGEGSRRFPIDRKSRFCQISKVRNSMRERNETMALRSFAILDAYQNLYASLSLSSSMRDCGLANMQNFTILQL